MNILELVNIHGKENITVILKLLPIKNVGGILSYTTSNDPVEEVPCKIIERFYALKDEYKIEFEPLVEGYPRKSFYVSDFNILLNREEIKLVINTEDNV